MLILASASKPRSCLLKKTGISHDVIISDIDEESFYENSITGLVNKIAFAKAESVAEKILNISSKEYVPKKISAVLACDSLFEFEGESFGKPRNPQEAFERWQRMSSSNGYIHTGHCLLFRDLSLVKNENSRFHRTFKEVISTKIYFNQLSEQDIWDYIYTNEPMNCAGGFALEGIGGMFIRKIEGCYSNVIGLSLPWLRNILIKVNLLKNLTYKNV